MPTRIDSASRVIGAPPSQIYAAFASADALETWLPPDEMTGSVLAFDFREGGRYRMCLTYTQPQHTPGKTTEHTDEVEVRFVRLIPNQRIEQAVIFDAGTAALAGEMKMTWLFEPVSNGTRVTVSCENVPGEIRPEDHATGLASSLANRAAFVERGASLSKT